MKVSDGGIFRYFARNKKDWVTMGTLGNLFNNVSPTHPRGEKSFARRRLKFDPSRHFWDLVRWVLELFGSFWNPESKTCYLSKLGPTKELQYWSCNKQEQSVLLQELTCKLSNYTVT